MLLKGLPLATSTSPRKAKLLTSSHGSVKFFIFISPTVLLLCLTLFSSQSRMPLVHKAVFQTKPEPSGITAAEANLESLTKHAPLSKPLTRRFCDSSNAEHPCIFDIGLNTGQDTFGYLAAPNTRVVAVEANPTLINNANVKFASELRQKRLTVVRVGLTDLKGPSQNAARAKRTITFWVNTANDKFGSFVEHLGCRSKSGALMPKGDHSHCRKIEIETKTCYDLIREYGTPEYMKIDIEGMDRACFLSLRKLKRIERPKYLSVENVFSWDIDALLDLGYTKFKIVNQAVLDAAATEEMKGHSGPWGENAEDQFIGKRWHTEAQAKARLPLPATVSIRNGKTVKAWYDLHAGM